MKIGFLTDVDGYRAPIHPESIEKYSFDVHLEKNIFDYLKHERLLRSIMIGTIPIIFLGGTIKLFFPYFFEEILRSNLSIAIVSILMAIFMYLADSSKKGFINLILFSAFLHNSQFSVVTKINSDMYYVLMRPWTLVFIILLVLIIFISGSIAISNLRL